MVDEQPSFHDASLEAVTIDFEAGVARVTLAVPGEGSPTVLVCRPFRRIVIDRDEPWGPSSFVMAVRGGDERLDIEMQSGDHILVYGPDMRVTRA